MKNAALALGIVALLASPLVHASEAQFEDIDIDDDGVLTFEEMTDPMPELTVESFNEADLDESGVLDLTEFDRALADGVLIAP